MSEKILVITVGSSADPIINACCEYEPDFTYFICSKGDLPKGTEKLVDAKADPCGNKQKEKCPHCGKEFIKGNPKGKAIVTQAGIHPENYKKIILDDPDDLDEVYRVMEEIAEEIDHSFPDTTKKAINFTGGTKTMTSGAVLFGAHHPEWELAFQKGIRKDNIKVTHGDKWWPIEIGRVHTQIQLDLYKPLLAKYQYAVVKKLLRPLSYNTGLPKKMRARLSRIIDLCSAFDAWDKFDHVAALEWLEKLHGGVGVWIKTCKHILNQLSRSNPYQQVADMVLNAHRRAQQDRFEDAVARYYRALEMLAQVRLEEEYEITTGEVDLEKVPKEKKEEYAGLRNEKGVIQLPLVKSYQLLADMDDCLGNLWLERKNQVSDKLQIRNYSILAHGTEPVNKENFLEFEEVMDGFLMKGLELCGTDCDWHQLPGEELLNL